MQSIEEKIEDEVKRKLEELQLKYYAKTESINPEIDNALKTYMSKSKGIGGNYPDIKLLIDDIPIMIEAKGNSDKLCKTSLDMAHYDPEGKRNPLKISLSNSNNVVNYAVNGAIHYCHAILTYTQYEKCLAIGIAGESMLFFIVSKENVIRLNNPSNKKDLSFLIDLKNKINEETDITNFNCC